MKMVGGGEMQEYPPADERPHAKGPHEDWQESYVLWWWDSTNAVGGYFRVGQEPNRNGGIANLWAVVYVPGDAYFRSSAHPLTKADFLDNGMGAASGALTYRYDGRCRWTLNDTDIAVALELIDFHPAIDGYSKDGKPHIGASQSNHVEVACQVIGTITARGRTYRIDGLGMRDHGWGNRNWLDNRAHRWAVGVFDRDHSFCAVNMQLGNGHIARFGWVVRGAEVIYADNLEIVARIAADNLSNRGGTLEMNLSTGEVFHVNFEPLAPCALFHHSLGLTCVDTLSRISWGKRSGIGVFETSFNAAVGVNRPAAFDGGIGHNGWHPTK
jgi:hypothetical protein